VTCENRVCQVLSKERRDDRRHFPYSPVGHPYLPRYTEDMTNPQTKIQQRIIERARDLALSPEHVANGVNESELYGEFSHGTYRNLVTEDYDNAVKPRTTINKQLVIALSEVLECQVSDLATGYELQAIRELPYRRAQWPAFLLSDEQEKNPDMQVPSPGKTANIIDAYMHQYGYGNYTYFAQSISNNGYRVTGKQLVQAIGNRRKWNFTRKYVTYGLCEAVAKLFRGPSHGEEFRAEWLITCRTDGRCPHCDERLLTY
jgi:hypothetical protein